jgi:CDP-diacylglycerol--serine O-phosphatidyltransferase
MGRQRAKEVVSTLKKIAILPTLLTVGNAVCGFAAIAAASKIGQVGSTPQGDSFHFALSGWLIIGAMLFDGLDGYVARLAKSASKFGGELDSLCDAISFGAAPAFLVLRLGPGWDQAVFHQLLACIATLYMVCAILRLARFNVENTPDPASHKRFRGLPSPGAAGCLASLAILRGQIERWRSLDAHQVCGWIEVWVMLGAFAVALLMVSNIPYPHVTKQILRGRHHFNHLIQIILAAFVIVLIQELALVLLFWAYAVGMPLRYAWVRKFRHEPAPAPVPGLDDPVAH